MPPLRPLVALMTDFGTRDPYVSAVRGVIAMRADCDLVDLTHEIAPFDAFEAAWFLRSVAPAFDGDRRVVFVCVIDPGVGSSRKIVLVAQKNQFFLAPDNGLLHFFLGDGARVWSVENESFFLPGPSSTFHGRDRFAPVAAALVNGIAPDDLGPPVEASSLVRLPYEPPDYDESTIRGTIVAIDRYGNIVTDIESSRTGDLAEWILAIDYVNVPASARTFSEAPAGEPFFYAGSRGTIEIAIREESAADRLHLSPRTSLALRKRK